MDRVIDPRRRRALCCCLVTLGASLAFALTGRWLMMAIYLASLPLLLRLSGAFRGRENVGMFLLLTVTGLPANLGLLLRAVRSELFREIMEGSLLREILWGALIIYVLFSLEQVVMAAVVRFFWRRQSGDRSAG